jgi:hypothetical protein
MHEILVHRREVVAVDHRVHQVFAHCDQRPGAARRKIEPAEQLLAARLGRKMEIGGRLIARLARPCIDRRIDALAVDAEVRRERLEEGDARAGRQLVVTDENLARERHARCLAASGQQLLAQVGQALRACRCVTAPVAGAVDQRAATLRNGLEQFAEKRGVHTVPMASARRLGHPTTGTSLSRCRTVDRGLRGHPSRLSAASAFPLGRWTGYQV